jgi:hypothetical protein
MIKNYQRNGENLRHPFLQCNETSQKLELARDREL